MLSKQAFSFIPLSFIGASSMLASITPIAENTVSKIGNTLSLEPVLPLH